MRQVVVKDIIEEFFAKKEYRNATSLCALMTAFGSDKGDGREHNYTTLYSKLFEEWKKEPINLFELGIGTNNPNLPFNMGKSGSPGASLYAWRKFFPHGRIFGADIDKSVLFSEKNIETFYCDQGDEASVVSMLSAPQLKNMHFDIIIDDGCHEFKENLIFLACMWPRLKHGGIYIIEDLSVSTTYAFSTILEELKKNMSPSNITIVEIPMKYNTTNNNLLIIQK